MSKQSKITWIIIAVIVVIIAALSITTCINTSTTVDLSDFKEVLQSMRPAEGASPDPNANGEFDIAAVSDDNAIETRIKGAFPNASRFVLSDVVFDGYNISFRVTVAGGGSGYIAFSSVYGRTNMSEYETLLDNAGINYSYTDPNAGSIWSSLLPLLGMILVAVVFFIIMMQTQGGTKSAMNFAKTNARLNHNIKVRFSDVAGAEEEKEMCL